MDRLLTRKLHHIGTGPLFMLTWPLYSSHPSSRFLCASVPLAFAARLVLIGAGLSRRGGDEVRSMTRGGDRAELLRGPAWYGAAHVVATVCYWRSSPTGIMALLALCVGDGIADIAGRRIGGPRWPHSPRKTLAGTGAFVLASTAAGFIYLRLFTCEALRNAMAGEGERPMRAPEHLLRYSLIVSAVSAAVETLPLKDVDNLTLTAAAACTSGLLLR